MQYIKYIVLMESSKENKFKSKSRIPIPREAHPLNMRKVKDSNIKHKALETNERYPLRTLNSYQSLAIAGPSQRSKQEDKPSMKFDTRFVTLRQKDEKLDWDYKVFKDDVTTTVGDPVIIISDDEDTKKKQECLAENKQKKCIEGHTVKTATPALKSPSLEPNRVKNIKRSLKRPHSKELQGLSSKAEGHKKVAGMGRRINFNESLHERLMSPDILKRSYTSCLIRDYATEMFSHLLDVEQKAFTPKIRSPLRACVINWLMKVNGPEGNPATVQTAIWYLDNVLATGLIQVDNLQLVASSCFWIATKLLGPGFSASNFVRCSKNAFTSEQLLCAEKAVMYRLKFPRQPVVPQDYITYLSWCCDSAHPGKVEVAATFMCMTALMVDKSLCSEHPSVIGAACVRNSLVLLRKQESMVQLQTSPVFRLAERKTVNLSKTCYLIRHAIRIISCPSYEYKAPIEHYGIGPHFIAQRIIKAVNDLFVLEKKFSTEKRKEYNIFQTCR